jgi:hypothetical protein
MPLRVLRLLLIVIFAGSVVLFSIPDEVTPAVIRVPQRWSREFFRHKLGLYPAHPVFSGTSGTWNRHMWAARIVGIREDGSVETLHEWPEGLEWGMPAIGEDPADILFYQAVGKNNFVRLSRSVGKEDPSEDIQNFSKSGGVRRLLRYFCKAPRYQRGGKGPSGVRLEAFWSARSFTDGRVRMDRATVARVSCDRFLADPPAVEPKDPPAWYRGK